jgi:hypothetical protein
MTPPHRCGLHLVEFRFRNAKGLPPDMGRIQMSALVAGSTVKKARDFPPEDHDEAALFPALLRRGLSAWGVSLEHS